MKAAAHFLASSLSGSGGRERWLCRVARKHAGGNGADGFAISMPIPFEKSGAEGTYRRFKFEILRIMHRNDLPGFSLAVRTEGEGEPLVHMMRREYAGQGDHQEWKSAMRHAPRPRPAQSGEPTRPHYLPLLSPIIRTPRRIMKPRSCRVRQHHARNGAGFLEAIPDNPVRTAFHKTPVDELQRLIRISSGYQERCP